MHERVSLRKQPHCKTESTPSLDFGPADHLKKKGLLEPETVIPTEAPASPPSHRASAAGPGHLALREALGRQHRLLMEHKADQKGSCRVGKGACYPWGTRLSPSTVHRFVLKISQVLELPPFKLEADYT